MKISYIGLSCFLFTNEDGHSLAIDTFYDTPEHGLGPRLPENFKADLFLVSHPDEDHSQLRHTFIRQRRKSTTKAPKPGVDMFPDLDLQGTLVKEYNGDLNIAWAFTIDGFRILHLADNAHKLTKKQLKEIGTVDIVCIPMPKAGFQTQVENIKLLKPKVVLPSHLILPNTQKEKPDEDFVRRSISQCVLQDWITNPHANKQTVENFMNMFFAALNLQEHFPFENIKDHTIDLKKLPKKTTVKMFRKDRARHIKYVVFPRAIKEAFLYALLWLFIIHLITIDPSLWKRTYVEVMLFVAVASIPLLGILFSGFADLNRRRGLPEDAIYKGTFKKRMDYVFENNVYFMFPLFALVYGWFFVRYVVPNILLYAK